MVAMSRLEAVQSWFHFDCYDHALFEALQLLNEQPQNITFDPVKREFVAVGEYYKLEDKPFVNKSQGFFIKRFSEAGKVVGAKNYGWQNRLASSCQPQPVRASKTTS